jgi:hypothetical protein
LHFKIKASSIEEENSKLTAEKELYLRKAEAARTAMATNTERSKKGDSKILVFTFDLKKSPSIS